MGTRLFSAVLICFCFACNGLADVTGSILGTVRDSSHAVVAKAEVVVTNTETNFSKRTLSSEEGEYRILALPPGQYQLSATAPGFQQFVITDIQLKVNDEQRIDVTFQVGTVRESVSVEANTVQVETENTQLGQVIDSKKMLSLPLNGRSYVDLLGLQAGVAPTTSESIQQDRPVSGILSAGNVSVNGQRETANAFLVNGGDVSEGRNLGAGLIPNLDSIQEFRLITNSFDAEYGKFSGSVMNAITKSGTNGIHDRCSSSCETTSSMPEAFLIRRRRNCGRGLVRYKVQARDCSGLRITKQFVLEERPANCISKLIAANGSPQTVKGDYWAQTLSARLGYPVSNGEPYSGCSSKQHKNVWCVSGQRI